MAESARGVVIAVDPAVSGADPQVAGTVFQQTVDAVRREFFRARAPASEAAERTAARRKEEEASEIAPEPEVAAPVPEKMWTPSFSVPTMSSSPAWLMLLTALLEAENSSEYVRRKLNMPQWLYLTFSPPKKVPTQRLSSLSQWRL